MVVLHQLYVLTWEENDRVVCLAFARKRFESEAPIGDDHTVRVRTALVDLHTMHIDTEQR